MPAARATRFNSTHRCARSTPPPTAPSRMTETPQPAPAPGALRRLAPAIGALALLILLTLAFTFDQPRKWFGRAEAANFHGRDVSSENWPAAFTLTDMAGHTR